MDTYYEKNDKVKGYSIIEMIGEGRYGIAYLAINKKGKKVVVKQLRKKYIDDSRTRSSYEEKTLRSMDSPSIPKFISKFKDHDKEGYILEYIEGKNLYDVISDEERKFTKDEIFDICNKILDIIEMLQGNNIVHRDIRLPNVIVTENNKLVLIDFGLARFIDDENYYSEEDYWYLADFLIHLYYTAYYKGELDESDTIYSYDSSYEYDESYSSYSEDDEDEVPWYEELDISNEEKHFLKKLMGIEGKYHSLNAIRKDLKRIKKKQKGE